MKRIALSALVFVLVSLPSSGISQQSSRAQFAARLAVPNAGVYKIDFTADSMQRQDHIIRFVGNVEVRITEITGRSSQLIQVPEVAYNLDTKDIEFPVMGQLAAHLTLGRKE